MGVSIISPDGFAIKHLMPANCLIWAAEPLAPEWAIIHTEFTGSFSLVVDIFFIISSATSSEHFDQTSTTLLYFSPWVIRPSKYCCSKFLTFFSALDTRSALAFGVSRSVMPNDIPEIHAWLKPKAINLSQKITVSFCPQCL